MNQPNLTPEDQNRIWEYFQNEAPESFEGSRARVEFLLRRIGPAQSVLNVGCGSGILEEMALERNLAIYSVDPITRSIERLRSELKMGDRAKVGYIQSLPFADAEFDAVVISEVLEHLPSDVLVSGLKEIRRVLKPKGLILGTVPNLEQLHQQMVVCPCCGKRFHRWGHEQSFDSENIQRLLSREFHDVISIPKMFVSWNTLNWKGKLAAFVKLCFTAFGHEGSNQNIYFQGRKPD